MSSFHLKYDIDSDDSTKQTYKLQDLRNKLNRKLWVKKFLKNRESKVSDKNNYALGGSIYSSRLFVWDCFFKSIKKSLFFVNKISGSSFNNISANLMLSDCFKVDKRLPFHKKLTQEYSSFLLTLKQKKIGQIFFTQDYFNKNIKKKCLLSNKQNHSSMELTKIQRRNESYLQKPLLYPFSYYIKLLLTFYIPNVIRWFVYMWILFVVTFALYEFNRILNMIEMGVNTWSSIIHSCVRLGLWIYNKKIFW